MAQPAGQQIDLTTLSTQQLSQLQSRLSQELEHLTQSYARLRQAQGRFRDCIRSIQEGVQGKSDGELKIRSGDRFWCSAGARQ